MSILAVVASLIGLVAFAVAVTALVWISLIRRAGRHQRGADHRGRQ